MLNRFCLLRKTSHPLFLMDNIKLDGISSKIKFYIFALYFKFTGIFYEKFFVFLFYMSFTSTDIIFYNFLKLHLTLSEKKIFVTNCPFWNGFTQTPHPVNGQNLLSVTKSFCPYSLTFCKKPLLDFASSQ